MKDILKWLAWLVMALIIVFVAIKLVIPKFVETTHETTYNFNPGELRSQTKIVIWEQDFTLSFTEKKSKKYFNSDWLKFTSSIAASAKGKMGFHIDLSDSIKTRIRFKNDTVYISTPLELTYVQIDLRTIELIKKASIDPTLKISKDSIIQKLDQRAIQEFLEPTLSTIKLKPLDDQEKALSRLTGKPVRIKFSEVPKVRSAIEQWWAE
ncbi:MAG: hypothetical protein H6551_13250 [Chitinophagales bacterium]|nr:hypothetical protein [Chitinophagaceae bacterium]MCB9066099.1 hypothetical protein [Chitinophagales bacterium]